MNFNKKMKCKCSDTPNCLYYENADKNFFKPLVEIEIGNWVRLFKCKECDALWAIVEWDKYVQRYIVKVTDRKNWEATDYPEAKKKLLLDTLGGTEEKECIWVDCKNKRVKDKVFCIDHIMK